MGPGKAYRMGRIFGADGRSLVLPVDHGLTLGRVEGLEDPVALLAALRELPCDGFLMTPGVARHTVQQFAQRGAPARLLTLDTFFRTADERPAPASSPRSSRPRRSASTASSSSWPGTCRAASARPR